MENQNKPTNKELNNNLILDSLVKCSKCLQLVTTLMDLNNQHDLDNVILTSDEYKELDNLIYTYAGKLIETINKAQHNIVKGQTQENETMTTERTKDNTL